MLLVAEVSFQRAALRRFFQRAVHFFRAGFLFDKCHQVHHRDVGGGHAHGKAIELALHVGNHQINGLGGAGGSGNHAEGGGAGAAQVFVGKIENHLIVGIAVDGGHGAALDLEIVVHHLGHRRQAIGSAGCVGNNVVLGGVVHAIVHAQHDGDVFVGGGRGDDHL